MNITCIGTGYVGLVTGTCFAARGNRVTCVDIDAAKVSRLKAGDIPIYEPGLVDLVTANVQSGNLHFTTDLANGVQSAEIVFLALPTPPAEDGSADLSYVLGVCRQLEQLATSNLIVVTKSTVPVGTGDAIETILEKNGKRNFAVVSNPEFLREGHAVGDFMQPDRVVLGGNAEWALAKLRQLYKPFVEDSRILVMDRHSAELTKYAANAFLALKVTFINEVAMLSEKVGGDIEAVAQAIGLDERIGSRFLRAGIGYGGSCFPKDVQALVKTADAEGYNFETLKAVLSINKKMRVHLIDKLIQHFGGSVADKKIALWGLAFKPETDDIRESPALTIIDSLIAAGASVVAYDPKANQHVKDRYQAEPLLSLADDMYTAVCGVDALIIATDWQEFIDADLQRILELMKTPFMFDGRNMYQPHRMHDLGFTYISIGR
jgi:UDPglucose 6-dehydrogenase